jgi:hypothetical protein
VNVAFTVFAALMVTTQLPVPVHAPDQPLNFEPELATAVRVTTVPTAYAWLHVAPHAIPAGLLVTCPLPVPALATARSLETTNVAVTAFAAVIERRHVVLVPAHAPDQPVKR